MLVNHLDVFRSETLGASGRSSTHLTVVCPHRGRVISIDECVVCERSSGVAVTEAGGAQVVCATDEPPAAPTGHLVRDVMSRDVVCVREDTPLADARIALLERGFSGVPVVDSIGRPIGILSQSDLLAHDEDRPRLTEVWQAMTSLVLTLSESAPLEQAAALMAYEGIHRVPIVSADGRIVGIVSALDVMRWVAERSGYVMPAPRR